MNTAQHLEVEESTASPAPRARVEDARLKPVQQLERKKDLLKDSWPRSLRKRQRANLAGRCTKA